MPYADYTFSYRFKLPIEQLLVIPNVQHIIQAAIRNKRRLVLRYDGRTQFRVIEPHLLYKSGAVISLLGYQVRGHHSSRRRKDAYWRPFQLRKMDSVLVSDELYEPRLKEGFAKVSTMIRGETLRSITLDDEISYFNSAVCGPPTPDYLVSSLRVTGTGSYRIVRRQAF